MWETRKIIIKEEISIKEEFSASISVVFVMLKIDPLIERTIDNNKLK